ncbi:hypothetical protein HK097_010524 [Rhizophlyctis rosea]|uniref:Uncharacterized protein n=1 Tax=Rhizophlyctis rosea TaxID=64517 RepID=A0AAD5X3Y8_9FUNG|nr:hypothetical protein HK097_010524 [Rhizophlyctis rosea]
MVTAPLSITAALCTFVGHIITRDPTLLLHDVSDNFTGPRIIGTGCPFDPTRRRNDPLGEKNQAATVAERKGGESQDSVYFETKDGLGRWDRGGKAFLQGSWPETLFNAFDENEPKVGVDVVHFRLDIELDEGGSLARIIVAAVGGPSRWPAVGAVASALDKFNWSGGKIQGVKRKPPQYTSLLDMHAPFLRHSAVDEQSKDQSASPSPEPPRSNFTPTNYFQDGNQEDVQAETIQDSPFGTSESSAHMQVEGRDMVGQLATSAEDLHSIVGDPGGQQFAFEGGGPDRKGKQPALKAIPDSRRGSKGKGPAHERQHEQNSGDDGSRDNDSGQGPDMLEATTDDDSEEEPDDLDHEGKAESINFESNPTGAAP